MSAAAEEHDVDQVVKEPILAAIDAKIEEAERLASRYRAFRRLVEEALQLDIGQLSLEGLLEGSTNGHTASEPTPPAPAPTLATPGGAEAASETQAPVSAGSEAPDSPKPEGGACPRAAHRAVTTYSPSSESTRRASR